MSRSENRLRATSPANSNWGHFAQVLELAHFQFCSGAGTGSFGSGGTQNDWLLLHVDCPPHESSEASLRREVVLDLHRLY